MKRVLITACDYPDLDGVGCAYPYKQYLDAIDPSKEYVVKFGKGLISEPEFVLGQLGIKPEFIDEDEHFDEFIIVDASETKGIPSIVRFEDVIDVIDHRMYPDYPAYPNAKFRIEPVGAAATQIAEYFFFNRDILLSSENASLLLCAIYSNTVNLKSDTTTFRDHRMVDWLFTKVNSADKDLHERMYAYKTEYFLNNLEKALYADMHDDCSQFGKDIVGVMYQAEVGSGEALLERSSEVFEAFKKLNPERQYQMLIVQDAGAGHTSIISNHKPVIDALAKTNLKGEVVNSTTYRISQITMRKSIKKALSDRLGK
jgi:manganese-dependent inorganic pyrophosphatase